MVTEHMNHALTNADAYPDMGPWTVRQPSEDPDLRFRIRKDEGIVEPMGILQYSWPGSEFDVAGTGREQWPHTALRMSTVHFSDPESSSAFGTVFESLPVARFETRRVGGIWASTGGADWWGFIPTDYPSLRVVLEGKQMVYTQRGGIRESEIKRNTLVSIINDPNESRPIPHRAFRFPSMRFTRWGNDRIYIGLRLELKVTFEGDSSLVFGNVPPVSTNGIKIRIPEWDIEGRSLRFPWFPR